VVVRAQQELCRTSGAVDPPPLRALFTTQPGVGHLHPLLALARGLRRRGHEVAFASSRSFAPEIRAAGFDSFPAGLDWVATEMAHAFPDMLRRPPGPDRYAWARAAVFADRTARRTAPDLVALADHWRPDVIIRDSAEYGGCLAGEVLGVPHASVRTDTGSSSYADRHVVAGALDRVRADLGLPPDPDATMPFRYLQLSFAPAGLDEPPDAAAPTCHRIRPVVSDRDGGEAPPPWLDELDDGPTVYATMGTVFNGAELLGAIIDGLGREPLSLVVTVGRNHDPSQFGPQPSRVHIERWITQALVLPHCDAVVTHGGYGTVSAAMAHGVPLVLLPLSADQPVNAARCADLGVGVVIDREDRTPATVRAATRSVLDDPAYRRSAAGVARETRRRPGLDHAIDLVETLARERTPRRLDATVNVYAHG
jgi:UDP:flavonoid glycosyltransferase YjiC (YdhE family)